MENPDKNQDDPNNPGYGNPAFAANNSNGSDSSSNTTSTPSPSLGNPSSYSDQNKYNAIMGFYKTYLGRTPDQSGFDNWYNSNLSASDIESDIKNSPEAGWYKAAGSPNSSTSSTSTNGLPTLNGNVTDPSVIQQYIKSWAGLGQADPSLTNDPNYWVNRIVQTGGLNSGNVQYWQNAASGPSAFYLNPNRESGSGGAANPLDTTTAINQTSPQNQALINLLTSRANQSLNINPATDSIIRPQVDAFAATQDRSRRNYLNDLAESSSPYATGAQQTAATQTAEAAGQATGNLQSQLTQNELTARRTEIQNALSELGSMLTSDQQLALQQELGQLDAALRQQQINSGNDQFLATLGLNTANQNSYWDAVRSGLITA